MSLILYAAHGFHLQSSHCIAQAFHVLAKIVDDFVLVDEVAPLRAPPLLQVEAVKFEESVFSMPRVVI